MKFLVVIMSLIAGINLFANDYVVSYSQGYAQTSHEDLKDLNNFFIDYSKRTHDIDLKIVDNYPNHYYLQFELKFKTKDNFYTGFGFKSFSSGARLNYSDFSGELRTDLLSNSKFIYLLGQYDFRPIKFLSISPFMNYDLIFSQLEIKDYIRIYDESQQTTTDFSAFSHGFTFGTDLLVVIEPVQFGIKTSYTVDLNNFIFRGDYENEDRGMILSGDKIIQAKWGGYRVGLVLSVGI